MRRKKVEMKRQKKLKLDEMNQKELLDLLREYRSETLAASKTVARIALKAGRLVKAFDDQMNSIVSLKLAKIIIESEIPLETVRLEHLDLSKRLTDALSQLDYTHLVDIVKCPLHAYRRLKGFGKKAEKEFVNLCDAFGLKINRKYISLYGLDEIKEYLAVPENKRKGCGKEIITTNEDGWVTDSFICGEITCSGRHRICDLCKTEN